MVNESLKTAKNTKNILLVNFTPVLCQPGSSKRAKFSPRNLYKLEKFEKNFGEINFFILYFHVERIYLYNSPRVYIKVWKK